MFDGIDEVVLPAADIDLLETLYTQSFGFKKISEDFAPDSNWQSLYFLPSPVTKAMLLAKPKSSGGWIKLVQVPGLPKAGPAGAPDRIGPYALDFYHKNAAKTEAAIETKGWNFRSPAQYYSLPGTEIPVRERMLEQPVSGLVHASVQYRERGTRCVIDNDATEESSEVAAVVYATDRFDDAIVFATKVLRGQKYFDGRFDDPAVATMLALPPGSGFRAALFRGPQSHNARLEFLEVMPGGNRMTDTVPRVISSIRTTNITRLQKLLQGGEHGQVTDIISVTQNGVPELHLGLRSYYGATFDFFESQ